MKKLLFASVLALALLACKENKPKDALIENAVDNAESSVSGSFKSYRKDNVVDKIYFELIKNDKKLQALDTKIIKMHEESEKVLTAYGEILRKSDSYYLDANNLAKTITDSLVRQQIEGEIKTSSDQYNFKTKNITELISQVNKNNEAVDNLYTVFKIRKTLPEIEKYQNAHPLKTDSLNTFINKQNKLLEELKNLK